MERMSGRHPGYRRSSARGAGFRATFTPSGAAVALTTAADPQTRPAPATIRFSNSEGDPHPPDTAPVTRGMAVRFHPHDGGDTDLVAPGGPCGTAGNRRPDAPNSPPRTRPPVPPTTSPTNCTSAWNAQAFNPTRVTTASSSPTTPSSPSGPTPTPSPTSGAATTKRALPPAVNLLGAPPV